MKVLGVVSGNLGGDPRDTEAGRHCKIRDHRDGEHHSREPVENPSLPLDSGGKDKDTNNTKGEQGEYYPEGSVSSMGRMEESSRRLGPRTMGEREVLIRTSVVRVMVVRIVGFTSSTGGTDGDGA